MSHTPGPWIWNADNDLINPDLHTKWVSSKYDPQYWPMILQAFPTNGGGADIACENKADARLIANSPNLLESLRKLAAEASGFLSMSDIERHGQTNSRILRDRIEQARDLIAEIAKEESDL